MYVVRDPGVVPPAAGFSRKPVTAGVATGSERFARSKWGTGGSGPTGPVCARFEQVNRLSKCRPSKRRVAMRRIIFALVAAGAIAGCVSKKRYDDLDRKSTRLNSS